MKSAGTLQFVEVEHKYVVGAEFDLSKFAEQVESLGPSQSKQVEVRDCYFALDRQRDYILRHRFDREIQQLTIKGAKGDSQRRLEVNLDLAGDDQLDAVQAFLDPLNVQWSETVHKSVQVFEFSDCEITIYRAEAGGRSVDCIEVEAIGFSSEEEALVVISSYEKKLGLDASQREPRPLFSLLFEPN